MSYSVKRGSPLKRPIKGDSWRTYKNFLYGLCHRNRLRAIGLYEEYRINAKIIKLIGLAFNVFLTGTLIHYALTNRNSLSYGLMAALTVYYTNWLIETIKKPLDTK